MITLRPARTRAFIALALLLALPVIAQDGSYTESFAGPVKGWTAVGGPAAWLVADGRYVFPEPGWGRHMTVAPVEIIDGAITVRATPLALSEAHGWTSFGVLAKYRDAAHFVAVRFGAYNGVSAYIQEGAERRIESLGTLTAQVGREYLVRVEVTGDQLRVSLDGEALAPATIPLAGEAGRVGFYTETPAAFDDFAVEGARPLEVAGGERIEGTPRPRFEFATFQPDPLQPGEALPVRGQLHLYLRNLGDGPALLESVSLDGRDGNALVLGGALDWWRQSPPRIEPGEVGRVTLRLAAIPEERALAFMAGDGAWDAQVTLQHRQAEPITCAAPIGPAPEPLRINLLTFGPDLRTLTAYLQAPGAPEGGFALSRVEVNGRDVTARARFASRRVGAAVVPVRIALNEPLVEGRHVTVTVSTEQGVACGHSLRAFPSVFPLQICLFEQVRADYLEDIRNHGFTTIAPRDEATIPEIARLGFDLLPFGGGLPAILQWWRPEFPPVRAFWLDERDERPVVETQRLLDEAHAYLRAEGRYAPPQMINLVGPWNGTGIAFMDLQDITCHAYGLAGAANGRDFPRVESLPWRELRAGRRPWWPYFRGAEVSIAVDPERRRVLDLAAGTQRVIEPAQERMMTFGCVQLGAKGICHWAYGVQGGDRPVYHLDGPGLRLSMGAIPYPASRTVRGFEIPEELCRALQDTWDEIGRINAELDTIGPWLADSDPSPLARVTASTPSEAVTGGPAVQASALVSGLDTIVLVALNLNLDADWSGRQAQGVRSYDPVDATVALDLPEWLEPAEVFSVSWRGIEDLTPAREGRTLRFELPGLAIDRVLVVTADPAVRAQMAERLAAAQERLRAMETHVPVPLP